MAKDETISVKEAVHKLQLSLLDGIRHEDQLFAAGSLMSCSDYEDVVTERSIVNLCGYPLCHNPLPSDRPRKGRYRISLKEHKVYDLHETYMYCCSNCVVNSRAFAGSLQDERCDVSNSAKIMKILELFGELGGGDKEGLGKNGDLGFSELKIEEKEVGKVGAVPLEGWIGPSNAIEGYVPQRDRSSKTIPSKDREGEEPKAKPKSPRLKKEKGKVVNEMDFTSTIIIGDQFSAPKVSSGLKLKCLETNVDNSLGKLKEPKGKLASVVVESQLGIPEMIYDTNEDDSTRGVKEPKQKPSVEEMTKSNETALKSSVRSSDARTLRRSVTWADERKAGDMSTGTLCEFQEVPSISKMEVNSSGRSSSAKNLRRSVTRAAERKTANMRSENHCVVQQVGDVLESTDGQSNLNVEGGIASKVQQVGDVLESADGLSNLNVEGGIASELLASAEACVLALNQAAESVASGESDVTDAVSEAGIIILPQPHDAGEDSQKEEDAFEQELVPLKWPKKHGVLNANLFDAEDSWYDTPPDGFNLTLSSFSTMWMALFEWITSSSLAYIYGKDESSHEEFLSINGREYPRKIFSSEGRSSEIQQTMAVCLGRALPDVATNLRLKTPISAMEKGLDQLLKTMSFMDAVPGFKLKQWPVIVLLFLDALSVCRIPGLASHMTSGRMLLNKVLDGAKVSNEEYEIMKELIIPLGRVPQFSAQSGG